MSQFSSGYSANKASAPKSPGTQFDELNYSAQTMHPKSQFSLGYSAHKASAPRSSAAQFDEFNYSAHAMQPCSPRVSSAKAIQPTRPQRPRAQQLSLTSLTTQLKLCSQAAQESVQLRLFSQQGLSAQEPSSSV